MSIGLLTLHFYLPGCTSLKEKRSRIKPIIARLHREFNISVAEVDRQDAWQETVIACTLVSNETSHTQRALQEVIRFCEANFRDADLFDQKIEIL